MEREENKGAQDSRKKWKRSQQVCTNCRQSKLRCDFLDRFPEPCSRCAKSSTSTPCHVDPTFRRTEIRKNAPRDTKKRRTTEDQLSFTNGPQISSSNADTVETTPSNGIEAQSWSLMEENSTMNFATCDYKTLDDVTLQDVKMCFDEFYTNYHHFIPLILDTNFIDPAICHAKSDLIFWTICAIGSRPRPGHPLQRARDSNLSAMLGVSVRRLVSELLISPRHELATLQALVLLSEYYNVGPCTRQEDLYWLYSGLAIQMGLQMGLHRPHYTAEFTLGATTPPNEAATYHANILTWTQCFVTRQTLATQLGLPSGLSDDWVTLAVSHSRSLDADPCWSWIAAACPDLPKHLRLQRFALRLSAALGQSAQEKSGMRADAQGMIALLGAELAELEGALAPMAPGVAVRFLEAKLQLYAFGFRDDAGKAAGSMENHMVCYTTAVRIIDVLRTMDGDASGKTRAVFWPQSLETSLAVASVCLLKLAHIHAMPSKGVPVFVDRAVVLSQVSTAYGILKSRILVPNDRADKTCQTVQILAHRIANRGVCTDPNSSMRVSSRMSLGNLLYDAIHRAKDAGVHFERSNDRTGPANGTTPAYTLPEAGSGVQEPWIPTVTDFAALDTETEFYNWLAGLSAEEIDRAMNPSGVPSIANTF